MRGPKTITLGMALALMFGLSCAQTLGVASVGQKRHATTRVVVETFGRPFALWRQRFFYRGSDAVNYYLVNGGYPDPDKTAESVGPGLYIAKRGLHPQPSHSRLRIEIKPSIGLEASYFAMKISSAFPRMDIQFLDRSNRAFAHSCVPTGRGHVTVAVRIGKRGLGAIIFDGHGRQVAGNIHLSEVKVAYGPWRADLISWTHEWRMNRCVFQRASNWNW
ncbi:MAG: hypothetical protein KC609_10835 [Myxococcales bacterium]|nr:hypothetical protein [Myxococcales bacterium]